MQGQEKKQTKSSKKNKNIRFSQQDKHPTIHFRLGCFVYIGVLPFIFPPKYNITYYV